MALDVLLSAARISKSFAGVHALRNATLEVRAGEVHALIGENGAGKSTLIKIITGAVTLDEGSVVFNGEQVRDNSPSLSKSLGIAAIYQQPALFPELTVAENIAIGNERSGKFGVVDWRRRRQIADELLERVGANISPDAVAGGLSMPHSPRWHHGRLWLLESGRGSLATVDLASGKIETVARVPGFTRGLDFIGPLAFIGLSQLRETNAFTDIPITDDNSERLSGVWVVNIDTGRTVAFLKFSRTVQEIFAVQTLRGALFPGVVDEDDALLKTTYVLPDAALKEIRLTAAAPNAAAGADAD